MKIDMKMVELLDDSTGRKIYTAPKLEVFGMVRNLTQGGTGTTGEYDNSHCDKGSQKRPNCP